MRNERIAVLKEIDRLDALRCERCEGSGKKHNTVYCDCSSAVSIRELGKQLGLLTNERKSSTMRPEAKKVITVDLYKKLKSDGLSDIVIRGKFGLDSNALNRWKLKNGLVNKHAKGTAAKAKVGAPIKDLTVDLYNELKEKGITDKHIAETYDLPNTPFYRWKAANGLVAVPEAPKVKADKPSVPVKEAVETVSKEDVDEAIKVLDEALKVEEAETEPVEDLINKPGHYHKNGIDVIGFAEMQLPREQLLGFCRINVLKYVTRYDDKNGIQDLEKAQFYLEKLIGLESVLNEH